VRRPRRGERGVALLLVLWLFMVLGVLALDFARYMRDDAMAALNLAEETRGYYIALAGMNRALYESEQVHDEATGADAGGQVKTAKKANAEKTGDGADEGDSDDTGGIGPADGQWHEGTFAGGRFSVRVTDQGGLISLNAADETLLPIVLGNLLRGGNSTTGVNRHAQAAIDNLVNAIRDWRDADDIGDAESAYYLAQRVPYRAKNAYFDSVEELLLVKGVTPQIFYGSEGVPGLRELFSVFTFGANAKVNLRTAPPAVIQALTGLDPADVADLVSQRGDDQEACLATIQAHVLAANPVLEKYVGCGEVVSKVAIEARADLESPRNQSRVAAVADVGGESNEGVKILRWLDRAPWEGGLPSSGAGETS
jgi:general secretion pathway protein K